MKHFVIGFGLLAFVASCAPEQHTPDPARLATRDSATAQDPVCRMMVDPTQARSTSYSGKDFFFCSEECQKRFQHQPTAYYARSKRETPPVEVR